MRVNAKPLAVAAGPAAGRDRRCRSAAPGFGEVLSAPAGSAPGARA